MATCILTDTWPLSYLYWLPFLAFESLLFALALAKGVQSVREHDLELTRSFGFNYKDHGGRAAKALEVLIRDSVLYFMLCVSAIKSIKALPRCQIVQKADGKLSAGSSRYF